MFSAIINDLLQKNNVSAYKLAKDIGVSEAIISKWRNGIQEPKYDSLQKLSTYFNVSADYLLGLSDNPCREKHTLSVTQPTEPDEQQKKLLDNYNMLNETGQKSLLDYSDFVAGKPEYLKADREDNKIVS